MRFLLQTVTALELLTMFIGIPAIVVVIAIAASKGKPQNFDREMYWTLFAAAGILSAIGFYFTTKIRTLGLGEYLLSATCTMLVLALFGVSMGCGIAIFTYRRPPLQVKPE
jgi:EamA domain-containing membrane protein RarD